MVRTKYEIPQGPQQASPHQQQQAQPPQQATAPQQAAGMQQQQQQQAFILHQRVGVRRAPPNRGAAAIESLRDSTEEQIPKAPFKRVVYEVLSHYKNVDVEGGYRLSAGALDALQQAAEAHLTLLFQDTEHCAKHAGRKTIMSKDLQLAKRLAEFEIKQLEGIASTEL